MTGVLTNRLEHHIVTDFVPGPRTPLDFKIAKLTAVIHLITLVRVMGVGEFRTMANPRFATTLFVTLFVAIRIWNVNAPRSRP